MGSVRSCPVADEHREIEHKVELTCSEMYWLGIGERIGELLTSLVRTIRPTSHRAG